METDEYQEYQKLLADLYYRTLRSPRLLEENLTPEELDAELLNPLDQPED
ncbi:MAG: hypothetical protein PHW74_07830 [Desulfobacca sp.]|nr:hypothetical protein [Desulfobacca sp.]